VQQAAQRIVPARLFMCLTETSHSRESQIGQARWPKARNIRDRHDLFVRGNCQSGTFKMNKDHSKRKNWHTGRVGTGSCDFRRTGNADRRPWAVESAARPDGGNGQSPYDWRCRASRRRDRDADRTKAAA
jgi:hypothetical protein